jgi:glycosyltransferase involved in cell wall biosynthesis
MRIAVDARELAGRSTGVGRYLAELLGAWSRQRDNQDVELTLFAPAPLRLREGLGEEGGARVRAVAVGGSSGTWWEQTRLPAALDGHVDVLFCPAYTAPLRSPVPFVVTIHDVSFCAHPEWFRWREGLRRRWTTRLSARAASKVVTDTEFSRNEIVRWLRIPRSSIEVIPPGAPRVVPLHPATPVETSAPAILFLGSILNRRSVPDLVRAFARVSARIPAARLVIAGENRTHPHEDPLAVARRLHIEDRVDIRSWVPEEELPALYANATVFAFLSMYEGFGLTPLEAMSAGVPVVVYDTPVAREVYGDAALFVPPGDLDGVAAALTSAIRDPVVRARLRQAAAGRLEALSWDAAARRTMKTLREAARA